MKQKISRFDSLLLKVAPKWAVKRAHATMAFEQLQDLKRSYEAATKGHRAEDWFATAASANTENRGALQLLRERHRDLARNNPYTKRALDVISTNTIGKGITPTPISKKESDVLRTRKAWKDWAETTACDFNGRLNFYGIQKLCMRAVAESGEVIVRRKRVSTKKCSLGIQLQVLEADYLDLNKTIPQIESGGYIIQGVEFNKNGDRIAYWLYQIHPGESSLSQPLKAFISVRVPADEIIHIFNIERPGQERGVPFGVSTFLRLRDFDQYEDAQLIRQKISACYAAFISGADSGAITGNSNKKTLQHERLEPGLITELANGKTITFGNPPPVQNYEEYSRKVLQAVAIGYGVSYEALTGDLSKTNFSSGRMGWLEFHRNVTDWQENLIKPSLCNTTWKWFTQNAFIAGFISTDEIEVNWTAPRREMIDPVKETVGITNQMRSGLRSISEAIREQGYDPEEVFAEIAKDYEKMDKLGIKLDGDMRTQITPASSIPTVPEPGGSK